jgi:membrane protease YdiL (CAAX protease family)
MGMEPTTGATSPEPIAHPGAAIGSADRGVGGDWRTAEAASAALARTGAFASVRARWLPLWVVLGMVAVMGLNEFVAAPLGIPFSDELGGILFYLPFIAWLGIIVARRAGVDLAVMFRWPRLGRYWWVVVGLFPVQMLFSLAAIIVTQLIAPSLGDALEDVGQGNLLLAVIGLVVLPPLVEETVFRGVLLERLAVKWRVGVAIVISSVAFGLLHADPVGAGMFGVMTCLLYLRSSSLWPGILLHLANNGLILVITRLSGPQVEQPPPDVSESLITAGVLLTLSAPFLVWFVMEAWPPRGTPTPYQWHELVTGLPERHEDWVRWSQATQPVRLTATTTHLTVGVPDPWAGPDAPMRPIAVLPLERVRAAYASTLPVGERVVLLLADGTWSTMQVRDGAPPANRWLAQVIAERAAQATWRAQHPPPPRLAPT